LVILAHPPNPNPTTKTHTTMKAFKTYTAVQLGRKEGGFSTAFCKMRKLLEHSTKEMEASLLSNEEDEHHSP